MLVFLNFPASLINLILSSISSPNLAVLFFGTASEPFLASREIRQEARAPYINHSVYGVSLPWY